MTVHPILDAAGSLTAEQQQALCDAHQRAGKIRAAARMAGFNGWVTGMFAVCSLPFAPFSLAGMVVAVGLIVVTYNEFRGRKMLLAFDPQGTRLLGWNQLGFLGLIAAYSVWMIVESLLGPGPLAAELKDHPELNSVLGSTEDLQRLYQWIVLGVYGGTILLSGIFQGLNAVYYFTRRQLLDAYLRETPPWILQVQRAAM